MVRSEKTLPMASARPRAGEELQAGTRIGRYVVQEATAEGGFAMVYRARSVLTGEDVALKVLHPDVALSSVAVGRLRQEAEALRRVAHPNIVQTFEVDELALEQPYLVMEWLRGHTLAEELKRRGTFSPAELLGVMEQLCAGLGAAHAAGIVHRDLKASNVMVLPKDGWFELKLVDFGIAKLMAGEPTAARHSLTTSGVTLGTPHYMAPEQVLGQAVDARADIYALGVLSYLLLTRRFPFHALNSVEIQEMHLYGAPPRVGDLIPVPAGVEDVIQRCLEKRRDQRPASVHELLDELRRAVRKPDGPASAPGPIEIGVTSQRSVVGLYVSVSFDGPDEALDDRALLALEEVLSGARDACDRAGLFIAFEGSSAWLCARRAEDGAARAEVIDLALSLRDRWVGCHPGVRVAIALHAEPARGSGGGDPVPPSGEPFLPGDWTSGLVRDAVIASRDALSGVEDRFELVEAAGPSRWLVRRRNNRAGAEEGRGGA
jgi:eukaryotic-like serine/threonine-protein kinase